MITCNSHAACCAHVQLLERGRAQAAKIEARNREIQLLERIGSNSTALPMVQQRLAEDREEMKVCPVNSSMHACSSLCSENPPSRYLLARCWQFLFHLNHTISSGFTNKITETPLKGSDGTVFMGDCCAKQGLVDKATMLQSSAESALALASPGEREELKQLRAYISTACQEMVTGPLPMLADLPGIDFAASLHAFKTAARSLILHVCTFQHPCLLFQRQILQVLMSGIPTCF